MKARLGGGAALLAVLLTGCGGSSDQWSKSEKIYREAVGKLNKAHDAFNAQLDKFDEKVTYPQYVQPINGFVTAIHAFDDTMSATQWPKSAEPDAQALTTADTKLIQALDAFANELQHNPAPDLDSLGSALGDATDNAADAADTFEDILSRKGAPAPSTSAPTPDPSTLLAPD